MPCTNASLVLSPNLKNTATDSPTFATKDYTMIKNTIQEDLLTVPSETTPLESRDAIETHAATVTTKQIDDVRSLICRTVEKVGMKISPVWPLQDYVAVNPYAGFSAIEFLAARKYLRTLSDLELFMPVDYYRQQVSQGSLHRIDIATAVDELVDDGVAGAERIDVNQIVALLRERSAPSPTSDAEFAKPTNPSRTLFTIAETIDQQIGSSWCRVISDEISKQCASHYDQGQAAWASESRELSLFSAWRWEKLHDRTYEILGVSGFRKFVAGLPHDANATLVVLLNRLGVPQELWQDYLLCIALTIPGWSAWTKYQHRQAELEGRESTDFGGLLAIRVAYEVALSEQLEIRVDWESVAVRHLANRRSMTQPEDSDLRRYCLLKASEIAYRNRLVAKLDGSREALSGADAESRSRSLAQLVFCIDVRSERIRRHLEATSHEISTYGFAGFFGLPIEFVELGADQGKCNVPVLLTPQFKVFEEIDAADATTKQITEDRRDTIRFLQTTWNEFRSSAVSMFTFVETMGLLYGWKLLARSIGWARPAVERFDGVPKSEREKLTPSITRISAQQITARKQVELAESILKGIGIVDHFARLVVFCGHASEVENNPLKAGLDCGACGGHSGEPNARLAAKWLNQKHVRQGLSARGIMIPEDTHFVGALHNTTTDQIEFFDVHDLPDSHRGDLEELKRLASMATQGTRTERLRVLPGANVQDLNRRSRDWSETRPEWGLAGNAAFIAAPREMTKQVSLAGRSFLHSYDYRQDPNFAVLEQIMTAPMVVASWINMQYFASTVDPVHFGSGNKTVHNVVGRFGVLSGNGGDLKTGLPWQSIHDGNQYQHHPLRLLVALAAPRSAIEVVLAKNDGIAELVSNGWIQLLAIEDDQFYRYSEQNNWNQLTAGADPPAGG